MSLVSRVFGFLSSLRRERGIQIAGPGSRSSAPAASVTFKTAMAVPAFYAGIRLLVSNISSMPLKCFIETEDGKNSEDRTNPLWRMMNFRPNDFQTRIEFFDTMMLNYFTNGNAYAVLTRRPSTGEIMAMIPLNAGAVEVEVLRDKSIVYHYTDENRNRVVISAQNMWHVKFMGNGVIGMSPLEYGANALGVSIATQNRQGKLAKSGGKTNGLIFVDGTITEGQREEIRRNYDHLKNGDEDFLSVLEKGVKFEKTSLSPQDMQLLETYRFQVQEVARITGVPSILLNDANVTAWGSGINAIMEGWYKLELRPHLERFEASIQKHLIPRADWGKVFIEFEFESLLRPNYKERVEINAKAINSGQVTPNEARADEGKPPKEGGDVLIVNGGLEPVVTISRGDDEQTPPQEPPGNGQPPIPATTEQGSNGNNG